MWADRMSHALAERRLAPFMVQPLHLKLSQSYFEHSAPLPADPKKPLEPLCLSVSAEAFGTNGILQ